MIRIVAFALAVAMAPLAATAEILSYNMTQDGLNRSYLLYVPKKAAMPLGPHPLVIVLHGGGGSAREVRYSTRRRFEELADAHGFYVLYPDAFGRVWDTGGGRISTGLSPRRDDAGFLRAAIAETARNLPVDPGRIFVTGISRGGMESYAFACGNPGLIRAIAPVAMTLPEASVRDCRNGPPLGFLLIHGTADPFVPYGGGPIKIGRRDRDRVVSAEETMALFDRRNRCDGKVSDQVGDVRRDFGRGCAVPTALYSVVGGGHSWPGGRKVWPRPAAGAVNSDVTAADEIWAFFSRF